MIILKLIDWFDKIKDIIPCNPNIAFVFLLANQCEYNNWEGDGDAIGHIWNWLLIPPIGLSDVPEALVIDADGRDEASEPRILLHEFGSSFLIYDFISIISLSIFTFVVIYSIRCYDKVD